MAVADWSSSDRWMIARDDEMGCWEVSPSDACHSLGKDAEWYSTFTEAHAAYLDAVTCDSTYDTGETVGRGVVRCVKERGHKGAWHECAHGGWRVNGGGAVFSPA
jgi:hypothetical protein